MSLLTNYKVTLMKNMILKLTYQLTNRNILRLKSVFLYILYYPVVFDSSQDVC